jgi:hypothetical protein
MVERFPPAPSQVRAASLLLVGASGLGIVVTGYAAWATATVSAGVGPLRDSLDRDDRFILRYSWVLYPDQPIPLSANLGVLIWLGLSFLVLLPLAYYVRRGFSPARTLTYLVSTVLAGWTVFATITDEDFVSPHQTDGPGLDKLSANAHQAWMALFPPGYAGIHFIALVAMIAALFLASLLLDRPDARIFFRHRTPKRRRLRSLRASHPRLRADRGSG